MNTINNTQMLILLNIAYPDYEKHNEKKERPMRDLK